MHLENPAPSIEPGDLYKLWLEGSKMYNHFSFPFYPKSHSANSIIEVAPGSIFLILKKPIIMSDHYSEVLCLYKDIIGTIAFNTHSPFKLLKIS